MTTPHPPNETQSTPPRYSLVAVAMASFGILGALAAVGLVLYRQDFSDAARFILVFALLSFLIAAILGLLSLTSSKLDFTFRRFVFSASGPAAIMIAVFWLAIQPEILSIVGKTSSLSLAVQQSEDADRKANWHTYDDWKKVQTIGPSAHNYEGDDETFGLKNVLSYAFMPRLDKNNVKLEQAKIETLVFYFSDAPDEDAGTGIRRFIKLQRVTGTPKGGLTEMYYTAGSSFAGGTPRFALFSREADDVMAYTNLKPRSKGVQTGDQWQAITLQDGPVDCMTVGFYPNGNDHEGDDFWIDVGKYTSTAASVYLGIYSEEPFKGGASPFASFWRIKPIEYRAGPQQIPVKFQLLSKHAATRLDDLDPVKADMTTWLLDLDRYLSKHSIAGKSEADQDRPAVLLHRILDQVEHRVGGKATFADFLDRSGPNKVAGTPRPPWLEHFAGFQSQDRHEPVVMCYNWMSAATTRP